MGYNESCAFCSKDLTEGGGGMRSFRGSFSGILDISNQMLARKFVCPSCDAIFCLECGNKKGFSLGTGFTHCPKCGKQVL